MAYVPAYPTRINWENEPSDATALNDVNLNKMDYAIYQHDQALQAFDGRISTLEGASYVNSFNGRTGAVTPAQDDYTIDQIKATGTAGQYVTLGSNGKLNLTTLPAYPTAGHIVVNSSGTSMTQRSKIKFTGNVSVTDDSTNDQTVVNITGGGGGTGGHTILNPSGSSMTQRTNLQFTGSGVSVSDNAGDDKTVVQITGGGGGGLLPHIVVTTDSGATVYAVKGGTTIYATETSTGIFEMDVTDFGTWVVHSVESGVDNTANIVVDTVKVYNVSIASFNASITITYPSGATVSCAKSGETTLYATGSPYTFTVHSTGTWTVTCTKGGITKTTTFNITTDGQTESYNFTPVGRTITPTDDIETLCLCAGVWDSTITTVSALLADTTTLSAVINSNNAIDYLVRSTTFATDITADSTAMSYIGLNNYASDTLLGDSDWLSAICNSVYIESVLNVKVPTMTSNTTPSGEASKSTYSSDAGYEAFRAFDGDNSTSARTSNSVGSYIRYQFTRAVKVLCVGSLSGNTASQVSGGKCKVQGSNNGTDWTDLTSDLSEVSTESQSTMKIDIFSNTNAYQYYQYIKTVKAGTHMTMSTSRLQFYGREDV